MIRLFRATVGGCLRLVFERGGVEDSHTLYRSGDCYLARYGQEQSGSHIKQLAHTLGSLKPS